jgi:hypothetical protein
MANRYKMTLTFKDGGKTSHMVMETWTNLSSKAAKTTLKDSLDVFLDDAGRPAEPDRAKIAARLMKYGVSEDNKIIGSEYARMSAAWPLYRGALAFLKSGKPQWSQTAGDGSVGIEIETA